MVVAGVLYCQGKVLVARKRPGLALAGLWEFPGGKTKPGESFEQALQRELHEELGIVAEAGAYIASGWIDRPVGQLELRAYWVHSYCGEFILSDHDAVAWLGPEELLAVALAPADRPIAHEVVRQLKTTVP